jgi:DNA uptake protein ComE-like DNA-binding protein
MNTPEASSPARIAVFISIAALLCGLTLFYSIVERGEQAAHRATAADHGLTIDPNVADGPTLQLLPGIGPALAERILAERATRPFTDAADLSRVPGIGPKTVERLAPYLSFAKPASSDAEPIITAPPAAEPYRAR